METEIEAAVQLANGEFIKGFISGQIILSILIFFLLKVFLFRNQQETRLELLETKKTRIQLETEQKYQLNTVILSKLNYNCATHAKESLDWLNVLCSLFIQNIRNEFMVSKLIKIIENEINAIKPNNMLGPINITEFIIGNEYPQFSNAIVTNDGKLVVNIQFSFDDQISLALETMVLINWPRKEMASLPISLNFTLLKFNGTLCIEFNQLTNDDQFLSFYISQDSVLDFGVGSLLGHRTKVKDLPKLTQMLQGMLKKTFYSNFVYPSKQEFKIPKFI